MEILKGVNFKVSHPGRAAWGGALCGLDSGVFASAVSLVGQERGFGDAALSAFAGIGFFGTFLATVVGGWLTDRFGRKAMVVAGGVLYLAGAVLLVAGSSVSALLYAGRAAGGVALGFLYLAIPLYLSETAPAAIRGRKVGAFQLLMTGGMLVGAVVAFGMTRAWMCFAVPAALAAAFAAFAFGLPAIPNPPPARTQTPVSGVASPSSAAALGLAIAIGVLVPLSGIGPVLDYSVSVFQRAGMDGFGVHGVDVLIKGVNFALTFPALLLADRIGRRALMIGGSFFMTLALAFAAAVFAWGGTDGAGLAAVGCLVYIAAFAVGPGVCMWLVIPELLPGPVRARGLSAALLADYASVTVIVTAFLPLVGRIGLSGAFAVLSVFSAALCAVSALCLRETRGKKL